MLLLNLQTVTGFLHHLFKSKWTEKPMYSVAVQNVIEIDNEQNVKEDADN